MSAQHGTARPSGDFIAARVRDMAPSPTVAVSDKARALKAQGIDVVDLGGGDPDFITPAHIRQAAADAMNAGETHYVASTGIPALRRAIAAKLEADNGLKYDWAKEVIVTPGGKASLFQAMLALAEPGTEILVLEPAWVSYVPMIEIAGGVPVPVGLDPDDQFKVTREKLEAKITANTRGLLVNSPNNPTGRVFTQEEIDAICDVARTHDLLVYSDEMYEKIIYDTSTHISIGAQPGMLERTLTFNGLSKAYAMTGWRLGYVAGPAVYLDEIAKILSHSVTCATSFAQFGGVAALTGPQEFIGEMVSAWDRRRRNLAAGLSEIKGLSWQPVEGAFYAFVDIRESGLDSMAMTEKLLNEARVAVTPGVAFGESGEGHIRLSFATSDELLDQAVQRIGDCLGWK